MKEKWIPELKKSHKGSKTKSGSGGLRKKKGRLPPLILVGTQSDLREDARTLLELGRAKEHPASDVTLEPGPVLRTFRMLVDCTWFICTKVVTYLLTLPLQYTVCRSLDQ